MPIAELAEVLAGRHNGWAESDYAEIEDRNEPVIELTEPDEELLNNLAEGWSGWTDTIVCWCPSPADCLRF